MLRILRPLLLGAAVSACAPHAGEEPASEPRSDREPESERVTITIGPAIATLVTREHRLEVHSSGGGPAFTVWSTTGQLLADGLSLWELARDYPRLHRQYETAFAGEDPSLDASVAPDLRECEGCERR